MKKNIVDWKPLSVITLRQKADDNKCYNISKTILLVFVLYWNWDFVNLGNIDHTIQMEFLLSALSLSLSASLFLCLSIYYCISYSPLYLSINPFIFISLSSDDVVLSNCW